MDMSSEEKRETAKACKRSLTQAVLKKRPINDVYSSVRPIEDDTVHPMSRWIEDHLEKYGGEEEDFTSCKDKYNAEKKTEGKIEKSE